MLALESSDFTSANVGCLEKENTRKAGRKMSKIDGVVIGCGATSAATWGVYHEDSFKDVR